MATGEVTSTFLSEQGVVGVGTSIIRCGAVGPSTTVNYPLFSQRDSFFNRVGVGG